MTEPQDVERELRALLRSRVQTLSSPAGVYETVRRQHRRSRYRLVLSAVAVVAVLAGLSVVVDRPGAGIPAGAGGVRGSLAGNAALLAEARRVAEQESAQPAPDQPAGTVLDAGTARVVFAEHDAGYEVLLVVGSKRAQTVPVWLARWPGQSRLTVLGPGAGAPPATGDARLGQRYVDPVHVLARLTIGDRSFGVLVYPAGYDASVIRQSNVAENCSFSYTRPASLQLRAGSALFPIERRETPLVTISTGHGVITQLALPERGDRRGLPRIPTGREVEDRILQTTRGSVPPDELRQVAASTVTAMWQVGVSDPPSRIVGLWAGPLPDRGGVASLVGLQYPSGAVLLAGRYTAPDRTGRLDWATACISEIELDQGVLLRRLTGVAGTPLIVVASAAAVRATVTFEGGAVAEMPLTGGGGFLARPGTVQRIRAYDPAGRLVGEGQPGQWLSDLQPR